jgi:hypothetical protein
LSNSEKMIEVYRANGEIEAQVIKGLLESYGIPCFLKGDAARTIYGLTVDGLGEVKIMVWESMAEEARRLIEREE